MEAKQTMGTRDIAGGVEHDDDPTVAPDDRLAERDDERADAPELFERDESSGYQSRWETIQTSGAAARTSRPRTCASRCSATAASSSACWPPDGVGRGPRAVSARRRAARGRRRRAKAA